MLFDHCTHLDAGIAYLSIMPEEHVGTIVYAE